MMRSLSSAVAGLRTHQTKMDVIGNNIANVNTYGFKASRTTFQDVYYQTLGGGRTPSGTYGGTNPTQIGYGSAVATIDILNTQAGMASTDRALDVYITGDGFLVTQDANGNYMYTRLGNMGFDADGNLCDANGNYVMGFPYHQVNGVMVPNISADGTIEGDQLTNIRIDPAILDELTGIEITAGGEIVGVLPGDAKITLNSAAPSWITPGSMTINEGSNYTGSVRLSVHGTFTDAALQSVLSNIGVPGLAVNGITFDPNYALMEPLTFAATPDANGNAVISMSGQYINEKGERINFTATGEITSTVSGDVLEMKAGDNVLFSANISGSNAYNFNTTSLSDANLHTIFSQLGITNLDTAPAVTAGTPTFPAAATNIQIVTSVTTNASGDIIVSMKGTYELGGTPVAVDISGVIDATGNLDLKDSSGTVVANMQVDDAGGGLGYTAPAANNTITGLGYLYQLTVKDKGGNVKYWPDNGPGSLPATGNISYDGISFDFDYANITSFNGIIAQIGTTEGDKVNIGCIVLANFRNANGLKQVGSSSYVTSANSGEARYGKPGLGDMGDLLAGTLEMSNVDISKEFTDMITTQRGFQANTRIVTVSDEMLQELVNLKR